MKSSAHCSTSVILTLVLIEWEVRWYSEPVWTFWGRDIYILCRDSNPVSFKVLPSHVTDYPDPYWSCRFLLQSPNLTSVLCTRCSPQLRPVRGGHLPHLHYHNITGGAKCNSSPVGGPVRKLGFQPSGESRGLRSGCSKGDAC